MFICYLVWSGLVLFVCYLLFTDLMVRSEFCVKYDSSVWIGCIACCFFCLFWIGLDAVLLIVWLWLLLGFAGLWFANSVVWMGILSLCFEFVMVVLLWFFVCLFVYLLVGLLLTCFDCWYYDCLFLFADYFCFLVDVMFGCLLWLFCLYFWVGFLLLGLFICGNSTICLGLFLLFSWCFVLLGLFAVDIGYLFSRFVGLFVN